MWVSKLDFRDKKRRLMETYHESSEVQKRDSQDEK